MGDRVTTWLTVGNLAVSFALLVVTTFYLLATIRISTASIKQTEAVTRQTDIMHSQHQVAFRPYVAILPTANVVVEAIPGTNRPAPTTTWFDIRLPVENVGNVMVKLRYDELSFQTTKVDIPGVFVLMPKQSTTIHGRFSVPKTEVAKGIPGHGRVRITYWLPNDPSSTYVFETRFSLGADAFLVFDDQNAT
jgi:hypothetical protein